MDAGHMQGSRIRLISKSEIRYEGTLSTIDPQANTVSLKNVRMHGTEGRPADRQIQASDARYDFIIFRGSDIKDLTVYEDDKRKQDFIDPAVVTAQPARGGKGGNNNRQQGGGFNAHNNNNNTHNNNNAHNNQHHGKGGNFQHQDKPARGMFDQFNNFDNRRQEPPRHENFGHGQVGGYGGHSGGKDHRGGKGGRVDFQGRGGKGAKGGNFHHNNHHNNHQHHGGNNQHNRHHDNNRRREPHVNPFATHTGTNFKAKDEEEAAEKRKNAGVEEEFNFTDKTMDMTKVKEEAEKEDIKADNGYDKKKSFFDTLSCETTDRGGAKPAEGAEGAPPVGEKKAQREKLRKYDIDTFGADAVTAIERSFHRERGHGKGGNHRNNHHAGRGMGGRGNMRRAFGGPAARGGRGQGVARGRRW